MTTTPNFALNVLGKKIAFSTIVQYAGKLLQLVISAVSLKIISNFLSQDGYGIYASIMEYALFFSTAANLGLFGNVVRLMADKPKDGKIFVDAFILRGLTGILFFALAIGICVVNGSSSGFIIGTALFCGGLFFDFLSTVCDGMLQANYMMGRAMIALLAGRILNLAVLFWIVKTAGTASATTSGAFPDFLILAATLSGSLLSCLLSLLFVSKKIVLDWNIRWAPMWKIFKMSLPYGAIFILNNLYFRFIPDYLAHNSLSDAYFGSFNIAFRMSEVASLVSTFLMFSALPGLTEYIDTGHMDKAKKLFGSLQKLLLAAGLAVVVFGSLLGPFAIALLTHAKYNVPEMWFVLPMMLLLAAISYGYDLVFLTLFAAKEEMWFLKFEFLALFVAGIFFGASYLFGDMTTKMALILLGAIGGELTMMVCGMVKIRKVFRPV